MVLDMTMDSIIRRISSLVAKATSLREDIAYAEPDERFWLREALQGVYNELKELEAQKEAMTARS
jgi:hypothetical protein